MFLCKKKRLCKRKQGLIRQMGRKAYAIRVNTKPWSSSYRKAKERCNDKNSNIYHRYGGRGIKFLLTREEIRDLWFRDKAHNLKKPSIDRIDNDGDYEYNNCRFIELSENIKRNKGQKKK